MARTDNPAKNPVCMPFSGMNIAQIMATTQATAILVMTSVPDLRNTVPVARKLIDAPMQKNQTARIGTVPVIIPFVKPPK
ncbi:Uncharacterised protein [Enterobacter cloacae]|nr:Uncharacterised protein [Enterobacter cloacae]